MLQADGIGVTAHVQALMGDGSDHIGRPVPVGDVVYMDTLMMVVHDVNVVWVDFAGIDWA